MVPRFEHEAGQEGRRELGVVRDRGVGPGLEPEKLDPAPWVRRPQVRASAQLRLELGADERAAHRPPGRIEHEDAQRRRRSQHEVHGRAGTHLILPGCARRRAHHDRIEAGAEPLQPIAPLGVGGRLDPVGFGVPHARDQ